MLLDAATMEDATCNVIYVNRDVREDRQILARALANAPAENITNGATPADLEIGDVAENIRLLVEAFNEVHVCSTGSACISKLFQIQESSMVDLKPTLVLIDTPDDERIPEPRPRSRSPSPHSRPPAGEIEIHTPEEEVYGLKLLQRILTESHLRNLAKLIVPIPIISHATPPPPSEPALDEPEMLAVEIVQAPSPARISVDRRLLRRCLDLGAVDVINGPLHAKGITNLEVHAYHAHREAAREQQAVMEIRKGRKRSWVGVNEEKPFAYLREAMVSGLMKNIIRPTADLEDRVGAVSVAVSSERQATIADAIGRWAFCAHDFSEDELLVAAMMMFKHALSMPELSDWRISTEQLIKFLVGCRQAYNSFVPFHNFRHVVDVLQATFHFLVSLGILPPYPTEEADYTPPTRSPMASLLEPFEALTLLITAIGHDVGHPGVNNGFLVTLNAPLAQLYNDRSVLESFHCAAYSQILRRYWPSAFQSSKMRNLMISSILATDMGLHFDYMKKLGDIQEKLEVSNTTDGWTGRMREEQKALACALLIKCADISNVTRKYDTAIQWTNVLTDEFSRQASMENELGIESALVAIPSKNIISLCKGQLGFMNIFAIPLFQGVASLMPSLRYTVDELEINKFIFEERVRSELAKTEPDRKRLVSDGTFSPRTMSFAVLPPTKPEPTQELQPEEMHTPGTLVDGDRTSEKEFAPEPTEPTSKPPQIPSLNHEYKEINGIVTSFETVADFASSDPFRLHQRLDSDSDGRPMPPAKQRCSETTDGSTGPYSGDWTSQATSATTGKMPLSPSTQGTSIVSRESMERPSSVPHVTMTIPEVKLTPEPRIESQLLVDEESNHSNGSNGTIGKAEGKALKKKPSRFRMNAFPFFRRHKGSSPPLPAADTAG